VCGDTIPDFARIGRQQQFLRAVIAKILRPQELIHAPSLVKAVAGNLTVSKITIADLIHLTRALQGVGPSAGSGDSVKTGAADFRAVPGHTATIPSTGQSVVIADPNAKLLFRRLRDGKPLGGIGKALPLTPPSPANIKVRVYDAGSGGKAPKVLDYLQKGGFNIRELAGSNPFHRVGILYRSGAKAQADVVHGYLSTLPEIRMKKTQLHGVQVAVIVQASYNGQPFASPPTPPPTGPNC
jgi:hypothetical protein